MRCFYSLPSFDSVEAELEDVNDVEDEESDEQFPSMMIITRFSVGVPSKMLEFRLKKTFFTFNHLWTAW